MPLYTLIAEHDGSTCVEQHVADTPRQAMVAWLAAGDGDGSASCIHLKNRNSRESLKRQLLDELDPPWTLSGCNGVWQKLYTIRKKPGTLHVIETIE